VAAHAAELQRIEPIISGSGGANVGRTVLGPDAAAPRSSPECFPCHEGGLGRVLPGVLCSRCGAGPGDLQQAAADGRVKVSHTSEQRQCLRTRSLRTGGQPRMTTFPCRRSAPVPPKTEPSNTCFGSFRGRTERWGSAPKKRICRDLAYASPPASTPSLVWRPSFCVRRGQRCRVLSCATGTEQNQRIRRAGHQPGQLGRRGVPSGTS
jgi:hypothetical protein